MEKRKEKTKGWIPKIFKKDEDYEYEDYEYEDDEYEDDEYEELEDKIEALTKENASMKSKLMGCAKDLREVSTQNNLLEAQLGQERALPQHYQVLEKKVIDYRTKIIEGNKTIEQLTAQLEGAQLVKKDESPMLEKHLAQKKEQLSQLTTLNTQLEKRLQILTEESRSYNKETNKSDELIEKIKQLEKEQKEQEEEYRKKIRKLNNELVEWKTELSQKQHENEQLTNQLFEEQTSLYRGKEFENQLVETKERIQKLSLENEQLRSLMESSKSEIADVMIEAKIQAKQILDQANLESAKIHNKTQLELQEHNREANILVSQLDIIQEESEVLFSQLKDNLTSMKSPETN